MNNKSFSLGSDIYRLEATAVFCGKDLLLAINGGEKPHIGAVAVGVPRPSLKDLNENSSSASVICLTGHKEDLLARNAALVLAKQLKQTVTVVVGIHIDNASENDLIKLGTLFEKLLEEIVEWSMTFQ